jgi:hypothetical protein
MQKCHLHVFLASEQRALFLSKHQDFTPAHGRGEGVSSSQRSSYGATDLDQGEAHFFCKGPGSKYFGLCRTYGLSYNYSTLMLG